MFQGAGGADVCMVEIGGTVGDIESLPFLEAIRQMGVELGRDRALYIHLTLVPFISAASGDQDEAHAALRQGAALDRNPARRARLPLAACSLPREQRAKIALFTNVEERAVISAIDVDDIYKIPMLLNEQGLDDIVVDKLRLDVPPADLSEWQAVVDAKANPEAEVRIAMVGKYVDLKDSYMSLNEALRHAGIRTRTRVNIHYIESEDIQTEGTGCLQDVDAILVPGGFGERGIEGKIAAVKFAREKKVPYLGICLGLQVAVIEYARHVVGLAGAHSTELNPQTPHPVIALITEWQNQDGTVQARTAASDLGGTMRLGAQTCFVKDGTLAKEIYGKNEISERHRHRYEFNNRYLEQISRRRPRVLGLFARRPRRADRAADASVVLRHAVPPGVHVESA